MRRDGARGEGEWQRPGDNRRPQTATGGHYWGREMPSLFIFHRNVERFIPRRAAAPFGPPSTQPVSRRAPRMCSRSASASVLEGGGWSVEGGGEESVFSCLVPPPSTLHPPPACKSPRGTCSDAPGERMTARSMTFCNSRTLPGQG